MREDQGGDRSLARTPGGAATATTTAYRRWLSGGTLATSAESDGPHGRSIESSGQPPSGGTEWDAAAGGFTARRQAARSGSR